MPTLAEAGIDKKLSSRAQKLAGVPEAVCLGSPRIRETARAGVQGAAGVVSRPCGVEARLWGQGKAPPTGASGASGGAAFSRWGGVHCPPPIGRSGPAASPSNMAGEPMVA